MRALGMVYSPRDTIVKIMLQLQDGEHIEQVCRRHWFAFGLALLEVGFGFLVIIASPVLLKILVPELMRLYGAWILPGAVLLAEIAWVILFFIIVDYYLDVWVITNERLIFVELHGLFNRSVASVNLADVQDISVRIRGIIPTLLRFGDVTIQSAGTHGKFVFNQIPRPDQVKDFITQVRAKRESADKNT